MLLENVQFTEVSNLKGGVSVKLTQHYGQQWVIHLEETTSNNVPLTLSNYCSQLVVKVQQAGEKQVGVHLSQHKHLEFYLELVGKPWVKTKLHLGF